MEEKEHKFILKSKTIFGIAIALIPQLALLLGFDWSAVDAGQLQSLADTALPLIGSALAIYGRMTAKKAVKVLPE